MLGLEEMGVEMRWDGSVFFSQCLLIFLSFSHENIGSDACVTPKI